MVLVVQKKNAAGRVRGWLVGEERGGWMRRGKEKKVGWTESSGLKGDFMLVGKIFWRR